MQFDKQKYYLLIASVCLLVLGYGLMIGGADATPETMNELVFSWRQMYLSPILILSGFGLCLYSIIKKPIAIEA